jgi:hypothetical protein
MHRFFLSLYRGTGRSTVKPRQPSPASNLLAIFQASVGAVTLWQHSACGFNGPADCLESISNCSRHPPEGIIQHVKIFDRALKSHSRRQLSIVPRISKPAYLLNNSKAALRSAKGASCGLARFVVTTISHFGLLDIRAKMPHTAREAAQPGRSSDSATQDPMQTQPSPSARRL